MASYTVEQLQEKLDKNLYWRKKELTLIRSAIDASEGDALIFSIRSGIAILYAHWEGYIKTSSREYLKYINALNLRCVDLIDNLRILSVKSTIVNSRKSNKSLMHAEIINEYFSMPDKVFSVNVMDKLIIDTESNLNYLVLKDILFSLGFDHSPYELKEHYIKDSLVEQRNKIVHGEFVQFIQRNRDQKKEEKKVRENYAEIYHEILALVEFFKEQILKSAIERKYLKTIPV